MHPYRKFIQFVLNNIDHLPHLFLKLRQMPIHPKETVDLLYHIFCREAGLEDLLTFLSQGGNDVMSQKLYHVVFTRALDSAVKFEMK